MRGEPVDWGRLAPLVLSPVQVAALEAMRWIDEPFSAVDLHQMHDEDESPGTPALAYHLRTLAFRLAALRLYEEEAVRGAVRKALFLPRPDSGVQAKEAGRVDGHHTGERLP
jgi:hypothetical protein